MRILHLNIAVIFLTLLLASCVDELSEGLLFEDEFDQMPTGILSSSSGALAAYYYLPDAGQKGQWTISSYGIEKGYEKAWEIIEQNGKNVLRQNYRNLGRDKEKLNCHFHSSITGGDSIWTNYSIRFTFRPYELIDKCGIMFRYQNSRSYYFFGMEGNMLMLKLVQHATAPHRPFEKILASRKYNWQKGVDYEGIITLRDERIYAQVNDSINLVASDHTLKHGKIGLLSDVKADFKSVEVSALKSEKRKLNRHKNQVSNQKALRLSENPSAELVQTISTSGFGSANNLRFGDLNGDGEEDILIIQLNNSIMGTSLACMTAVSSKGDILWQNGEPQSGDQRFTFDFPFQLHDIDGDGLKEIIYLSAKYINILNGETGERIRRVLMPEAKRKSSSGRLEMSVFFCDLEDKGRDGNMLIIDGTEKIYAFDERIRLLWSQNVDGATYPAAEDVDGDGRDEIASGFSLLDDNGDLIWDVGDKFGDDVNEVVMLSLDPRNDSTVSLVYGAGDWGCLVIDVSGRLISHHPVGHVQHLSVGNFRDDLEGLEILSSNFWGNQGLIHFYNSEGAIYNSFEPCSFSSRCIPVNWNGNGKDYFILNASSGDGGLYNGNGQLAVVFPDDGHPDLNHTVIDITGDARDEILVWDQNSIWIYTQNDSPRKGDLVRSLRTPLYNSSLQQSMVSIPEID